jgi:flagellar hook-length control protein FliK
VALDSILPTPAPQPPKAAARPQSSSPGPSGATNSPGSPSSGASAGSGSTPGSSGSGGGSDASASRTAAKNSGKSGSSASNRGASSTRGSTASTQSKNVSASSQAKQSTASSTQTQSTAGSGTGDAPAVAGASSNSDGPSFIEALAQSQAQAADSASTIALAAPEEVAGSAKSSKDEKSGHADDSPSSLGFLAQSIAAVMAGVHQQPAAGHATAADSSPDDASVDSVSLASGSSIQNIVASLTKGTATELKAATAADGDPKGGAAATPAGAADGSASGTSAFQAQMSVGSHFQTTTNTQTSNDKVSAPVGTPAFNDELGGKITWMANQGVQSASLQLSPEHLGPVAVHISVQDGAASVAFNANHADARVALEQALPHLREMFATQGLTLTDASVSQQSPRGQPQKQAVAAIGAIGGVSSEESTSPLASVASTRLGLVDTYA